jgi:hypothetical protein
MIPRVPLGAPLTESPFRDKKASEPPPKNKPLPRRMPKTMKFEKRPKAPKWA